MYTSCQSERPQRPKLPSFGRYEPTTPSPTPGTGGILSSCRALQTVMGGPVQPFPSPTADLNTVKSPYRFNPFRSRRRPQSPQRPAPPLHNINKRGRDEFEETDMMDLDDSQTSLEERDIYQTPKRQRRTILDLPLGLHASDFSGLESNSLPHDADRMDEDDTLIDVGNATSIFQFKPPQLVQTDSESTQWSSYSRDSFTDNVVDAQRMWDGSANVSGPVEDIPKYHGDNPRSGNEATMHRTMS